MGPEGLGACGSNSRKWGGPLSHPSQSTPSPQSLKHGPRSPLGTMDLQGSIVDSLLSSGSSKAPCGSINSGNDTECVAGLGTVQAWGACGQAESAPPPQDNSAACQTHHLLACPQMAFSHFSKWAPASTLVSRPGTQEPLCSCPLPSPIFSAPT